MRKLSWAFVSVAWQPFANLLPVTSFGAVAHVAVKGGWAYTNIFCVLAASGVHDSIWHACSSGVESELRQYLGCVCVLASCSAGTAAACGHGEGLRGSRAQRGRGGAQEGAQVEASRGIARGCARLLRLGSELGQEGGHLVACIGNPS